jgi:hypothetical protein
MVRYLVAVLAVASIVGSAPASAQAQTVVHTALAACTATANSWQAQDQWSIGWLSAAFGRYGVSGGEIAAYYGAWKNAFGVDSPCDGVTLSTALSGATAERRTAFSDCLRNGIENRRWAVQRFTEHYVGIAAGGRAWSDVQASLSASWEFVEDIAQTAGLRACRF